MNRVVYESYCQDTMAVVLVHFSFDTEERMLFFVRAPTSLNHGPNSYCHFCKLLWFCVCDVTVLGEVISLPFYKSVQNVYVPAVVRFLSCSRGVKYSINKQEALKEKRLAAS